MTKSGLTNSCNLKLPTGSQKFALPMLVTAIALVVTREAFAQQSSSDPFAGASEVVNTPSCTVEVVTFSDRSGTGISPLEPELKTVH